MRFAAVFALPALALSAFAATADEWKTRSIYQIVTDRFALGNGTFPPCNTTDRKYCGGDWRGIMNNLDYIQDMGFDAVWISPISKNINATVEGDPYHGYWTGDLDALNANFGDASDLKGLISELHEREMYMMLDVNVNNMAAYATPVNVSYLLPFVYETDYHPQCSINDYANQSEVENCWLGDAGVPLPDLNTENQTVVDMLNMWVNSTVIEFDIDGLRIDSAKHIRKDFWPAFAANASVFTIGEVYSNDTDYAAPYTNVLDSVLDYPIYFQIQQAFSSPKGNLSSLIETMQNTQSKYKTGAFSSGAFMENHDQPRFQSLTQDQALVKNAMAWTFATDGMPILYYGQEQGLDGANNPSNREALWLSGIKKTGPLVAHVTALNAARRIAARASPEFFSTAVKALPGTNHTLALVKSPLLALLSNGGNASTPVWNVSGRDTSYAPNTTLVDVLSCDVVVTGADGGVAAAAKHGVPLVLLPRSAVASSTLCGSQPPTTNADTSTSVRKAEVSCAITLAALALASFTLLL